MSDIEFIKRLPDEISVITDGGSVEMCRATEIDLRPYREDFYCITTGDPYCDPRMSWESWVAFARKIIAADDVARGSYRTIDTMVAHMKSIMETSEREHARAMSRLDALIDKTRGGA